nr:helicase POLQ-like [Aedes albopictus]
MSFPYPYGRQPPPPPPPSRPRMSGLFKVPVAPPPPPPASTGPRLPSASSSFGSRSDVPGPQPSSSQSLLSRRRTVTLKRASVPAATPVNEQPTVRGASTSRNVGEITRNLMDLDETLFNAVNLDVLEKQANSPPVLQQKDVPEGAPRSGIGGSTARGSPQYPTPRRKKARRNGLIVLDMTKDELHSPSDIPNLPAVDIKTANHRTRTIPTAVPPPEMISRDPTINLFDWDSQAFHSEVNGNEFNTPTSPPRDPVEDYEDFPCYQGQSANDNRTDPPPDDGNCSQLLLEEVARDPHRPLTQTGIHRDHPENRINDLTYSQYVRHEYSMLEENRANVADDEVDHDLAQEFDRRSQNRTMVEADLQICDQVLADWSNIGWDEIADEAGPSTAAKSRLDDIFGKKSNGPRRTVTMDSPKQVAKKAAPLVSSHFQDLGPFYGLPNRIRELLKEFRGITEMYDWQKQCLLLPAIVERRNLIYALPTSGGKTLVAEIIMFREVLLRRRCVMFIVPYVSLAQEKLAALSPFAVATEFLVEEYSGGKGMIPPRKRRKKQSIFVCTIEKALVLLDSLIEADRANEIGLICIDELHMIGEPGRGVNLEVLITKVMAIQAGIQIIGMSATIGNLAEIAKFMSADIFSQDFRPVELKEYVKCGSDLLEIKHGARTLEEAFVNKQSLNFSYSDYDLRADPDHVVGLVMETIPKDPCLIFCPTKRRCEQLCSFLIEHLPEEVAHYRAEERKGLIDLLANDGSTATLLPAAFRLGIAYHHSGLTFDERKLIEDAFRAKVLSLIICTSTLAAGVNLPAKRVIIRSPYIATEFLTLSRYKQMVGRAGRAGFGTNGGESILICSQKDISAVCNLLCSPMDEANSSLHADSFIHLKNLILSAVGLGICSTRNDIQKLVTKTLLAIQANRLGIDLRSATDAAIGTLYKENAIKAKSDGCLRNPANMTIRFDAADQTQYDLAGTEPGRNGFRELEVCRGAEGSSQEGKLVKTLKKSARLEVNLLGKAAIRAGFHMERATRAYDELKRVGERLHVNDELHLLYVIVMEDGGKIRPKQDDFISFFNKLSPEETRIAKRFFISDYTISMILTRRLDKIDMSLLRRFFRTLIVYNLWNLVPPQEVAVRFSVDAGSVQTLMSNAASTASGLQRFCEQLPELWAFDALLKRMVQRLAHCCTAELIPLMELPAVKIGRARQLYRAGYTSLSSIAKTKASDLVRSVQHMNYRTANQLILSAKAKLMEEFEELRGQMDEYLQLNYNS